VATLTSQIGGLTYTNVTTSTTFTIAITDCVVLSIDAPVDFSFEAPVDGSDYSFTIPRFTQTPTCDYDLDYTFEIPTELADIVTCVEATRVCTVNTDDHDFYLNGPYSLSVVATDPNDPAVSSEPALDVEIDFKSTCENDRFSVSQQIADFKYYIGLESGTRTETAVFTSTKKNCPYSVTLEQLVGGVAQPYNAQVISAVTENETFPNDLSVISIAVDHLVENFALDTEGDAAARSVFRITVCSSESTHGDACASEEWKVDHVDQCWDQTVTAADFLNSRLDMFVGDNYQEGFTGASSSSDNISRDCGAFTYEIWNESDTTASSVNSALFSLVASSQVDVSASVPEGEYRLQVRAQEGKYHKTAVFSDVLAVFVLDGCKVSAFSGLATTDLAVTAKGPSDSNTFAVPSETY